MLIKGKSPSCSPLPAPSSLGGVWEVLQMGSLQITMLTLFSPADWMSLVVGKISPWIQLDSTNVSVRRNSEKVHLRCLS